VSNIIVKHRHGLVTDCHQVPIVPQSAPMVSVADVSVKLYKLKIVLAFILLGIHMCMSVICHWKACGFSFLKIYSF